MNLITSQMNIYPFCGCCLSFDRKLTNLENTEQRLMFCSFLSEKNMSDSLAQPLSVCFECKAALLRIINFSRQVKLAQNGFQTYLKNGVHPKCLSKLSINIISMTNNYISDSNNALKNEYLAHNTSSTEIDVASDIKNQTEISKNDEFGSMFVKIENEVEELFFDDDFQNDDTENQEINIKTESNFQDSDDEPLCSVKKKKRKKSKKKIKNGVKGCVKPLQEDRSRVVYNPRVERKLQQLNVERELMEMVVLSWEEVESERQQALQSEVYSKLQYRCEHCALGFNHRGKLDKHRTKHSTEAGSVECSFCKIRFRNDKSLYAHRRRHRVRWRCVECGALWSRAAVCADHAARAHGRAQPTHGCAHCTHTAPTLGKLKLHMRSHSEPVSCELCGKTYRDKDTLRTHLFIHKGEKEYECSKCEKRFLFKKALEIHELTHGGSQFLYCHQCDVTFKNQLSYYQHMKYNLKHVDPDKVTHACASCGRRFARAGRLREHARLAHGGHAERCAAPCAAPGCHKSFASRASLRSHFTRAHRAPRAPPHVCHACGARYQSKKSLESHVRSHTGERPFVCREAPCAATFAHDAALYRHLKLVHRVTSKKKETTQTVASTELQTEN